MGKNAASAIGAQGRIDTHLMDPNALKIIEDDKKHPLYDGFGKGKGVPEDMVLNVMEFGLLQNVICRREGEAKNGKAILVVMAGRDRVRAARIANERLKKSGGVQIKVPVVIKRGDDKRVFGMMLSENVHRKTLSPFYKAKQMQRYMDFGATEADAMRDLNISSGTVKNYKALLECSPLVQKAVDAYELSGEAAIELAKLPHPEQDKALAEMVASGNTKGMKAKESAQNARDGKKARPDTTLRMFSRKRLETIQKVFAAKETTTYQLAAHLTAVFLGNQAAMRHLPEAIQQTLREVLK